MKEENREVIIVKHEQIMVKEENKLKLATYIERQKMLRVTIIKEEKEWNLYLISWKVKIENIDIFYENTFRA